MKLTSKGFPTIRCKMPSLDEVLEDDVEFHLERMTQTMTFMMMMAPSSKHKARSLSVN